MKDRFAHCATLLALTCLIMPMAGAAEFHVSPQGDDANDGSPARMLKTIAAAARLAQPGDVITVHEGVYRESVAPPRGGESDEKRIVYQAAPGEHVEIKGSEVIRGWEKVQHDTWKVVLPNTFFGKYNPYGERIRGDWFNPKGRNHHTGAVYLDGHWLVEAANRDEVMAPAGTVPSWFGQDGHGYLLNVAWMRPLNRAADTPRIEATHFTAKNGTANAEYSEGGQCIGFILNGHWVKYEDVDFRENTEELEIRAAAASNGGNIEIRLDAPDGDLVGTCPIPFTGGWQSWASFKAAIKPVSGKRTLCLVFKSRNSSPVQEDIRLWYAEAGETHTTIWAQFKGINPNERLVEINVRKTIFYPEKPFVNYITVRGFFIRHAATQWAPPTAEQTGAIGVHWSKGWIIENNDIRYSVCTGISLGKYGDQWDNTSADTAEGYVKTIERALENGWNKETIGGHIVRGNTIAHCEQAGIVGSMGAAFSTVTGNTIHDIHVRQLFTGAEMAGIKFHGAIDTVIAGNHIYRCVMGLWLDWMAQGARVSRNLFHDNAHQDLFVEVNHGPFLVDNNLFLSKKAVLSISQGGAYAHNLIAGNIHLLGFDGRMTPFHKAHSTELAGMHNNPIGDDRLVNNLFARCGGLKDYDKAALPVIMKGNVYLNDSKPPKHETDPLLDPGLGAEFTLSERADGFYLEGMFDAAWVAERTRPIVTTDLLGKASIPGLPYENRDGSPIRIGTDYFGNQRNEYHPFPGPFEVSQGGKTTIKIWPVAPVDPIPSANLR
ncbi:MAG TPA: carbohydrate-binding protein [Candidatus Hydrogenedentes bacterium]|nr:carbohydrate-binding protein [Candidatus Hydrogenedentota bacterium]